VPGTQVRPSTRPYYVYKDVAVGADHGTTGIGAGVCSWSLITLATGHSKSGEHGGGHSRASHRLYIGTAGRSERGG